MGLQDLSNASTENDDIGILCERSNIVALVSNNNRGSQVGKEDFSWLPYQTSKSDRRHFFPFYFYAVSGKNVLHRGGDRWRWRKFSAGKFLEGNIAQDINIQERRNGVPNSINIYSGHRKLGNDAVMHTCLGDR